MGSTTESLAQKEDSLPKVTLLVTVAVVAFTANSHATTAKVTDPRKCPSTPAYCASHAAGRAAIAKVKATRKTVGFVQAHCDQRGSLLRWQCGLNDSGGHGWKVNVTYRGTSSGWRVRAVIVAACTC